MFTFLGDLLNEDVANRIHNQDLAVFCLDTLFSANWTSLDLSLNGRADAFLLCNACASRDLLGLTAIPLCHALLLAIPLHSLSFFGRGSLSSSGNGVNIRNTRNDQVVAPSKMACTLYVAVDEVSVSPVAGIESKVMSTTTEDEEHAKEDGTQAWTEARVVVSSSSPFGETILQEVIVTLSALVVSEHIGDDTESGETIAGFFGVGIDLTVGRFLAVVGFRILVNKGGASLVGVQVSGSLAVDFVDLVDRSTGFDTDPGVESDIQALVLLDSVVELEYFIVYTRLELAGAPLALSHVSISPSLDQAATKAANRHSSVVATVIVLMVKLVWRCGFRVWDPGSSVCTRLLAEYVARYDPDQAW